jgi:hypothetical protein
MAPPIRAPGTPTPRNMHQGKQPAERSMPLASSPSFSPVEVYKWIVLALFISSDFWLRCLARYSSDSNFLWDGDPPLSVLRDVIDDVTVF